MSSSLVTPNFSTDALGKHADYIQHLSRKYATLSKLDLEERPSEPRSPQADEERMLALRGRIQEAWARADGDPSSGKWALLARLLRMGVTTGRGAKWVGARADVKPPECPKNSSGWLSTASESDWIEWERKFVQDQKLKNMVETWKKGVEATNHRQSRTTKDQTSHTAAKDSRKSTKSHSQTESGVGSNKQSTKSVPRDPLRDSAPFGFGVVKRSSQTNVLKPNPASNKMPYDGPDLPAVPEAPESSKGADSGSVGRPKEKTTNRPELQLSFSGAQLVTSTPKKIVKPTTSLVARSEVSSLTPFTSSPGKRALLGRASSFASPSGRSKKIRNDLTRGHTNAASLPAIPSLESPLRHTTSQPEKSDTHDVINRNNKRLLGSSHSFPAAEAGGSRLKKPKISDVDVKAMPQTPPRHQQGQAVPTLTELLASARRVKRKRPSGGNPQLSEKKDFEHKIHSITAEPRPEVQTTGGGQESGPIDNAGEKLSPFFDASPADDVDDIRSAKRRPPEYDFYSHINDFNMDLASPAKSLSIAGGSADEEEAADEAEFVLDSSFRPLATSTQVQGEHQHRRGPFVSKSNLNPPTITQPDDPIRSGGTGGNPADSWESIYAPRDGGSAPLDSRPANSSIQNKNNDSFLQLSYNSQFESVIAAQVAKVNNLLQRDVDYDGLLTKEREEEEGNSLLDSSDRLTPVKENEYSYGYGKAFDYDQSL